MSTVIELVTPSGYSALVDISASGASVDIYDPQGVWATEGRVQHDAIVDAPGNLPEEVWVQLDAAILAAQVSSEVESLREGEGAEERDDLEFCDPLAARALL